MVLVWGKADRVAEVIFLEWIKNLSLLKEKWYNKKGN